MTPTPRLVPDRPVTEEVIAAALNAQPLTGSNKALRVWQLFDNAEEASIAMKGALDAALAAMAAAPPAEASADLTIAHPSRGVVDESVIRDAIARAIGCGYAKGHNDTVEGTYTDVSYSDRIEFHSEMADDLLTGDPDFSAIQSLQAAALPAVPEGWVYGWLIENGKAPPDLRYRAFDSIGMPYWTDDNTKAIRLCRREDAEQLAAGDEDAWRIVEHGWIAAAPAQEAQS